MKRILTIPLLFIYIIAVSGVMIQLHYCGQELESWNLYAEKAGCADDGCEDESSENDGCCKDEVITAKIVDEQNTASELILKFVTAPAAILSAYSFEFENATIAKTGSLIFDANAPPGLWQGIPLYLLHSGFTYYG